MSAPENTPAMAQQSLEKSKIRFLLLEGVHPSAIETLNRAGYFNIEQHSKSLAPEELKIAPPWAAVLSSNTESVTRRSDQMA